MADWYAQLLAESIGKRVDRAGNDVFAGPTPVRAVGVTDQHSQVQLYTEGPFDKWFTLFSVDRSDHAVEIPRAYPDIEGAAYLGGRTFAELFAAERDGTRIALTEAGRPNVTLAFEQVDAHSLGADDLHARAVGGGARRALRRQRLRPTGRRGGQGGGPTR